MEIKQCTAAGIMSQPSGGAKIRHRGDDEKPLANYVRVFEGMPDPLRTMSASKADIETHPQKWIRQTNDNAILVKFAGGPVGWWRYSVKGLRRAEAKERGIRAVNQGEVDGKRSGMTQNINRAARQRWQAQHKRKSTLQSAVGRSRKPTETGDRPPARVGKRQIAAFFEPEVGRALRMLAAEGDTVG
ncbi:MAG: ribbon-helix-helix domain-containing protein [Xanthobacteraceae bacterium]